MATFRLFAAAALLSAVFVTPAAAQTTEELWTTCRLQETPSDRLLAVDGCTALTEQRLPAAEKAEAFRLLGDAHRRSEYNQEALLAYTASLRLAPGVGWTHGGLGLLEYANRNYTGAITHFNRALELSPDLSYAYDYRARANHDLGNYVLAVADYSRAIQLNPRAAGAFFNRGSARMGVNVQDYTAAIADYEMAIQLDPSWANFTNSGISNAFNERGVYQFNTLGYIDAALRDFQKSVQLNPNNTTARDNVNIAQSRIAQGQQQQAQRDREEREAAQRLQRAAIAAATGSDLSTVTSILNGQ